MTHTRRPARPSPLRAPRTARSYAAYYFELRTLCEKEERAFSLKPLSTAEASRLQSKTAAMEEGLKSAGVRREWASSAR